MKKTTEPRVVVLHVQRLEGRGREERGGKREGEGGGGREGGRRRRGRERDRSGYNYDGRRGRGSWSPELAEDVDKESPSLPRHTHIPTSHQVLGRASDGWEAVEV